MSESNLMVHCGARHVDRDELDRVASKTPAATKTWFPIPHNQVLKATEESLNAAGFRVTAVKLALTRDDNRLFAALDTATSLNGGGVTLAVALMNSVDRSLAVKFLAGNRCFCCDNLALRSDLMAPVRKKHSKNGMANYRRELLTAITSLENFRQAESARIHRFQYLDLPDPLAESVMLRAYEREIVSHRLLPRVIDAWRKPQLEEFEPRTFWSLENAFTGVLADVQKTNPSRFVTQSIALQNLLLEAAGPGPKEANAATAA